MPINYQCPHCGTAGVAEDQYAGQTGNCVSCGESMTIPQAFAGDPPKPAKSGTGWVVVLVIGGLLAVCLLCCGPALLLPAINAAREAARRNNCMANSKMLVLSMHTHHDGTKRFPPAVYHGNGEGAVHSWRSRILPYIEENTLYKQIDFDESWDSPQNLAVYNRVIPMYDCPSSSDDPHFSNYYVIVGDEAGFLPDGESTKFSSIADGTSKTIMIIEGNDTGYDWYQPEDFQFDDLTFSVNVGPTEPASEHPGLVLAGLFDGSVHSLNDDIDPQVLRALMTRRGADNKLTAPFFREP